MSHPSFIFLFVNSHMIRIQVQFTVNFANVMKRQILLVLYALEELCFDSNYPCMNECLSIFFQIEKYWEVISAVNYGTKLKWLYADHDCLNKCGQTIPSSKVNTDFYFE